MANGNGIDDGRRYEVRYRLTTSGRTTEPRVYRLDDLEGALRDIAEELDVGEEREHGGAFAATTIIRRIA